MNNDDKRSVKFHAEIPYNFTKATADHKTPAQIIDEMVRERVVAAAV